MADLFSEVLPNVVEKRDYDTFISDKTIEPYLINRALAMNPDYITACNNVNFWLEKDIWKKIIWHGTPKSQFKYSPWIKTKKDDMDWFYKRVATFYDCSLRSLESAKQIIMATKELHADLVGLDNNERKKLGIEVNIVKIEKMKPESKVTLKKWFT